MAMDNRVVYLEFALKGSVGAVTGHEQGVEAVAVWVGASAAAGAGTAVRQTKFLSRPGAILMVHMVLKRNFRFS